jgi:polyferredoxin
MKKFNILLQKWYFPISLKYISLVAYIILIVTGLLAYSTDAEFLKQLRNTNLGNLIVWSYWWPAIVIMAIFFGRIWCMVCPVEIITTFFAKIGLKRKRPKWLLSGWAITIFYIIILFVGIQGFAIHRNPFFMAIYLLVIVGVSIIIGSIYEKNTFCRYVCPVGYLLGLYSRLSFFGWRVKDKSVCDTCKDKSCIHKKYQYNLNAKSCGVDLYPANITDNANCILCAGCLKTCNEYQSEPNINRPNPEFRYIGFANDLFKLKPLKIAEMVFVLVVSGFVISEIWSEWKVTDAYLNYLPNLLINPLSIENKFIVGLIKGTIIFGVIPTIIWLLPWLISSITKAKIKIKEYFLNYGIAFIPIIAAAHLDKAILKTISRIPYFNHLFDDVTGLTTAQRIIDKEIIISQTPNWLNVGISILMTVTISIGIYLSVKVIRLQNIKQGIEKSAKTTYLIPIIYGSIFLVMILIWRWNM